MATGSPHIDLPSSRRVPSVRLCASLPVNCGDRTSRSGRIRSAALFALWILVLWPSSSFAFTPDTAHVRSPEEKPPSAAAQIIVRFRAEHAQGSAERLGDADRRHGLQRIERVFPPMGSKRGTAVARRIRAEALGATARADALAGALDRTYRLQFRAGADVERLVEEYRRMPEVEYAEPDYLVTAQMIPNDPYYASQGSWGQPFDDLYGVKRLGTDVAWDHTMGSGVVVAVIDSGVDRSHVDLAANIWSNPGEIPGNGRDDDGNGYVDDVNGWDFVNGDADPGDDNGHGTHVAGTVAAIGQNGVGIIGVAPQARIMAVKGLGANGSGPSSDLARAVRYAADNGADVLNNSWGGYFTSQTLTDAFEYAQALGCVSVAGAGNDNRNVADFTPANLASVIAVGAVDRMDLKSSFSNYGVKVDVAAPGEDILSLRAAGTDLYRDSTGFVPGAHFVPPFDDSARYYRASGTSMACPHVAGVAALIVALHPEYDNEEVRSVLRSATDASGATNLGTGIVNARKAVEIPFAPPVVEIVDPGLLKGSADIRGTARGVNLTDYQLYYGAGTSPTTWTLLQGGTTPVDDGVLLPGFDTWTLADGLYTLKLVATNSAGYSSMTLRSISVSNIRLTYPYDNDIVRRGGVVTITGRFGNEQTPYPYAIEVGRGFAPTSWSSAGITLTGAATGALATWDTAVLPADDFYSLRVTVTPPAGTRSEIVSMVYLTAVLRPGWPVYLQNEGRTFLDDIQQTIVADLDGDGDSEIVAVHAGRIDYTTEPYGEIPAQLEVYDHQGRLLWAKVVSNEFFAYPAVGDLDGDGHLEVLVESSSTSWYSPTPLLNAYRADGTAVGLHFPVRLAGSDCSLTIVDLDGDGTAEILALSQSAAGLTILRADGSVERTITVPNCTVGTPDLHNAAAGNFDDDPELEIAVRFGNSGAAVYNRDGSLVAGWPVETNTGYIGTHIAVGDLDGDHYDEVLVTGRSGLYETDSHLRGVFAFRRNGTVLPGWPVLAQNDIGGQGTTALALGDLDGDGLPEVCTSLWNKVYLFHGDGSLAAGWPQPALPGNNGYVTQACALGDVNGDGRPDVVIASNGFDQDTFRKGDMDRSGGVVAWNADATRIDLNPFPGSVALFLEEGAGFLRQKATPVLADVDGDGALDIVASSVADTAFGPNGVLGGKGRNSIFVFSLGNPFNPALAPWPANLRDAENTGRDVALRPGFVIRRSAELTTTEAGGTAGFTMKLGGPPAADVTVPLTSSDPGEGVVSPAALTFTAANWALPQKVTVTGVDDGVPDGDAAYQVLTAPAVSADAHYDGLNPLDVAVTSVDDDGRRGDVNANGQVTALDASMILQIVVGTLKPDAAQSWAADANGSGAVTALDAATVLQCVVGSGPCP
jgi:subtilisin family serine protease